MSDAFSGGGSFFGRKASEAQAPEVSKLPVVPIVFLPGIMGSNLRVRDSSLAKVKEKFDQEGKVFTGKAWNPPSVRHSKWLTLKTVLAETLGANSQAVVMAKTWESYGPKLRQVLLNPDTVEVDEQGFLPSDFPGMREMEGQPPAEVARKRGWGSVHWDSYGTLLQFLETNLNPTARDDETAIRIRENNVRLGMCFRDAFDCDQDVVPSKEEILKAVRYRYPVHAMGYNWTQSNLQSAKDVLAKIEACIHSYQGKGCQCRQVILVTHSMGGLVGRIASVLNPGLILGVVHGVMPAIGSPDAYQTMVSGVARDDTPYLKELNNVFQSIAGRNAAETTPVMANSPGALELLPSFLYPPGWLRVERELGGGRVEEVFKLPSEAGPYSEIYKEREGWWRLVDPNLLDPAGMDSSSNDAINHFTAWMKYTRRIDGIEIVHKKYLIGKSYHQNTIFFYGKDKKTYDSSRWMLGIQFASLDINSLKNNKILIDNLNGLRVLEFHLNKLINNNVNYQQISINAYLQSAVGKGDGTVPVQSGIAPLIFCKYSACLHGINHVDAFKQPLSKFFSLVSIYKLIGGSSEKN
jgi:pimeloyl-ACP methyl ester carboxylesterase